MSPFLGTLAKLAGSYRSVSLDIDAMARDAVEDARSPRELAEQIVEHIRIADTPLSDQMVVASSHPSVLPRATARKLGRGQDHGQIFDHHDLRRGNRLRHWFGADLAYTELGWLDAGKLVHGARNDGLDGDHVAIGQGHLPRKIYGNLEQRAGHNALGEQILKVSSFLPHHLFSWLIAAIKSRFRGRVE